MCHGKSNLKRIGAPVQCHCISVRLSHRQPKLSDERNSIWPLTANAILSKLHISICCWQPYQSHQMQTEWVDSGHSPMHNIFQSYLIIAVQKLCGTMRKRKRDQLTERAPTYELLVNVNGPTAEFIPQKKASLLVMNGEFPLHDNSFEIIQSLDDSASIFFFYCRVIFAFRSIEITDSMHTHTQCTAIRSCHFLDMQIVSAAIVRSIVCIKRFVWLSTHISKYEQLSEFSSFRLHFHTLSLASRASLFSAALLFYGQNGHSLGRKLQTLHPIFTNNKHITSHIHTHTHVLRWMAVRSQCMIAGCGESIGDIWYEIFAKLHVICSVCDLGREWMAWRRICLSYAPTYELYMISGGFPRSVSFQYTPY